MSSVIASLIEDMKIESNAGGMILYFLKKGQTWEHLCCHYETRCDKLEQLIFIGNEIVEHNGAYKSGPIASYMEELFSNDGVVSMNICNGNNIDKKIYLILNQTWKRWDTQEAKQYFCERTS